MAKIKTTAEHILKKWTAELSSKDRSRHAVPKNFEELMYEMWCSSVPFDIVEELLPEAIKAHLPNKFIADITFKQLKSAGIAKTDFQEFMESWKKNITDKAYEAFYEQYPIDGVEQQEEKKFGNMSAKEYTAQRKYAESFPILNIEELKQKREEFMKVEQQGDDNGEA
jgi:hypothetical protein